MRLVRGGDEAKLDISSNKLVRGVWRQASQVWGRHFSCGDS